MRRPAFALVCALCAASLAHAQDTLSLAEAIGMAREANGTIRAAFIDVRASRSRLAQAFSDFFPTITPSARYDLSRSRTEFGGSTTIDRTDRGLGQINANWRLLDAGQRELTVRASRRGLEQSEADALQTLREVLFLVHQQFFDALRAQEQLRVQEASVERANEILKFTDAQIAVGAAPRKDRLQANADVLNAQVEQLIARNDVSFTHANLKATIGLEPLQPLPPLEPIQPEPNLEPLPDLQTTIRDGLARREDLRAQRLAIESQRLFARRTELEAGITWTLDANYVHQFAATEFDDRGLTFLVSYPLFDGNFRREAAREARLGVEAAVQRYRQFERTATAEIETAYRDVVFNRERFAAARAALEAAQENFRAAAASQQAGAEGTNVITTLTAKISLVTAESNFVDAVYDMFIAEVRLKLVTGQPIPGEST